MLDHGRRISAVLPGDLECLPCADAANDAERSAKAHNVARISVSAYSILMSRKNSVDMYDFST